MPKYYAHRTTIGPFDKQFNAITGLNGRFVFFILCCCYCGCCCSCCFVLKHYAHRTTIGPFDKQFNTGLNGFSVVIVVHIVVVVIVVHIVIVVIS